MQLTNQSRFINACTMICTFALVSFGYLQFLIGQDQAAPANPTVIEISDEPRTIDPATFMPAELAAKVSVRFDGEPLKAVLQWFQRDSAINVLVDYKALANVKILDTDSVSEELVDAPRYLLLNRLETLGIGWFMQDGSLNITSREESLKHDSTVSYNLGDLFDAGYLPADLVRTITRCTGGRFDDEAGQTDTSSLLLLGDVLFVRQTEATHREIAGLLTAIRKHGRRTLTLDSPQHDLLRSAFNKLVTIDFQETPLIIALQELSLQSNIRVRLDRSTIRERTPVTLKLTEQKLSTVLRSLLSGLGLTSYLRDEVLWVTNHEVAQRFRKTAVYDVRDLCRDQSESNALVNTIQKQTRAKWSSGTTSQGTIEIPKSGVLVARHIESALDEVSMLLENYRAALRVSKVRKVPEIDPAEVVTGYYRLPAPMAEDLRTTLPKLISPATWLSQDHPDAVGTILEISADAKGGIAQNAVNKLEAKGIVSTETIMVIRQSRTVHQAIGKLLQSLNSSQLVDREATNDTHKKSQSQPGAFGAALIPAPAK